MRDNCYYLQSEYIWEDEIDDEYEATRRHFIGGHRCILRI